MSPVNKANAALEAMTPRLADDPLIREKFNDPNLNPAELRNILGITQEDFDEFGRFYAARLTNLIQADANMALHASAPPPKMSMMPDMKEHHAMSRDDHVLMGEALVGIIERGPRMAAKAAVSADGGSAGREGGAKTSVEDAEALVGEVNEFADGLEDKNMETQFYLDLQRKVDESEAEIERIVEKIKRGEIHPMFLLAAIAKATMTINGFIMTKKGREVGELNLESKEIMDVYMSDEGLSDTDVFARTQEVSQKQKEITQSQSFLIQDMNKCMQNIETAIGFAHEGIQDFFKNQAEMARNVNAR